MSTICALLLCLGGDIGQNTVIAQSRTLHTSYVLRHIFNCDSLSYSNHQNHRTRFSEAQNNLKKERSLQFAVRRLKYAHTGLRNLCSMSLATLTS